MISLRFISPKFVFWNQFIDSHKNTKKKITVFFSQINTSSSFKIDEIEN